MDHGTTGFQETLIPQPIFPCVGAIHFQCRIRILFPIYQLTNTILEGVRVILQIPIKRFTIQHPNDQTIGKTACKQLVFCPQSGLAIERKGSDLTSYHGIIGHLISHIDHGHQFIAHTDIQVDAAQMKGDFDILSTQRDISFDPRATGLGPKQKKIWCVAKEFHHHFHAWDQQTSRSHGCQMRIHDHRGFVVPVKEFGGRLQGIRIVMCPSGCGGNVIITSRGRQLFGHIHVIHPTLKGPTGYCLRLDCNSTPFQ